MKKLLTQLLTQIAIYITRDYIVRQTKNIAFYCLARL